MASGGAFGLAPLRFQCEVNHHDGILLHDSDQHDDAHERIDVQIGLERSAVSTARQTRPREGLRESSGMYEAFIQNSQDDIDHEDRNSKQAISPWLRHLEGLRRTLKAGADRCRKSMSRQVLDLLDCLAQ